MRYHIRWDENETLLIKVWKSLTNRIAPEREKQKENRPERVDCEISTLVERRTKHPFYKSVKLLPQKEKPKENNID